MELAECFGTLSVYRERITEAQVISVMQSGKPQQQCFLGYLNGSKCFSKQKRTSWGFV